MDFNEMQVVDARRFCELTRVRGPLKLAELASWLRADRVDLRQFDGSLGSLVPLWQWAVGFIDRDCPGVSAQARPSSFTRFTLSAREEREHASTWSAQYLGEGLVTYLAVVAARADPAGGWAVYETHQNHLDRNQTKWRYGSGAMMPLRNVLTFTTRVEEGVPIDRHRTKLREFMDYPHCMTPDMVALAHRPGTSVLNGLPAAPAVPLLPFADLPPDQGGPVHPLPGQPGTPTPPVEPVTRSEPLWLARGRTRWLSSLLGGLKPLQTTAVIEAVRDMGFTQTGQTAALTPSTDGVITPTTWTPDLSIHEHELSNARNDATLLVAIEAGAIRSLCLELHDTPTDVATTTLNRYHALATQLGATITPDSDIDWQE